MKKGSVLVLSLLFYCKSFAQPQRILNNDSVVFMRSFRTSHLVILQDDSRQAKYRYYYYLNNVKTDSTNTPIQYNFYNRPEGEFYFIERRDEEIVYYKISQQGRLIEFLKSKTDYFGIIDDKFIGIDQNSHEKVEVPKLFGDVSGGIKPYQERLTKIVTYNTKTGVASELFHIKNLGLPEEEDIIELFFLPNQKKILFTTGIYESGGQPVDHIYVFDINSGLVSIKSFPDLRRDDEKQNMLWRPGHLACYDITSNYLFISDYILDSEFNVVARALHKNISFLQVYLDQSREFFWVPSEMDFKKKWSTGIPHNRVLIPYRISVEVESNLYKIFNNQPVEKKDLSKMRKEDLNLLKNMVFAKHNYQFDSEYYQAFFNLFNFYNNPKLRKERTKEVSKLLTEADKRNLSLVTQQLSRIK